MVIVVIIAGGSGTRLWPLSTPGYPKHLLTVGGDFKSLLQNTYDRAKKLSDKIYVISEAGHIHHVKEQLPELEPSSFIVEPARRGTASCIVAALVEISKVRDANEPIAFLAADHYVRDTGGFVHSFNIAAETSQKYGRIVLVGVEPDYPATGFGYIQKDGVLDEKNYIFNVDSFTEKPDYDTATKYLASGNYLWNCGYFVGSLSTFKKVMEADAPNLYGNYQALAAATDDYERTYLSFESVSIDYALIEKATDLLVVPASFDWLDLGSFADLAKAVGADEQGNHVYGERVVLEEVQNSFVQNHEDKPVAVIGLDNCVVINTPDGILVTRKDLTQKVGDVSKRLQN